MVNRIQLIEEYTRPLMVGEAAHDFKHADRVRHWALKIARQEHYTDLDCVQATALMHDVGLVNGDRKRHAEVGAEMAANFLRENHLFEEQAVLEITNAIRNHNALEDRGLLAAILRDADILDLLGAVGIMRAFMSKADLPEYDPHLVKGETWDMSAGDFTERLNAGVGIGEFIVDQINFQISCRDNLTTPTAKNLAIPLVSFMLTFMQQLESQVTTATFI